LRSNWDRVLCSTTTSLHHENVWRNHTCFTFSNCSVFACFFEVHIPSCLKKDLSFCLYFHFYFNYGCKCAAVPSYATDIIYAFSSSKYLLNFNFEYSPASRISSKHFTTNFDFSPLRFLIIFLALNSVSINFQCKLFLF
jgi:hypothetical protein